MNGSEQGNIRQSEGICKAVFEDIGTRSRCSPRENNSPCWGSKQARINTGQSGQRAAVSAHSTGQPSGCNRLSRWGDGQRSEITTNSSLLCKISCLLFTPAHPEKSGMETPENGLPEYGLLCEIEYSICFGNLLGKPRGEYGHESFDL